MSAPVVFVTGSLSPSSRSSFVSEAVAAKVGAQGFATRTFSILDFEPQDILRARGEVPALATFLQTVKSASAIVLSTPVYKATYAGVLKALVDLIAPDALVGKPALGIATTRLPAHGPEVSRAYLALFGFFRAQAFDSLVVLDEELRLEAGLSTTMSSAATERVEAAASSLVAALRRA
jgi:FMN reductase